MSTLLNDEWRALIGDLLDSQPGVKEYLGEKRPWTIPPRERTFAALNGIPLADVKVVIIGQDPYPRAASANGVAFYDSMLTDWTKRMSPSFRNVFKSGVVSAGLMDVKDKTDVLKAVIKKHKLANPCVWFEDTMAQGVLWLNTSFTFTSTEQSHLKRHTGFWRPIFHQILVELVLSQKGKKDGGLVFGMFGGYAQAFEKHIKQAMASANVQNIRFVKVNHPAAMGDTFHDGNPMAAINKALTQLNVTPIDWLLKADGSPRFKTAEAAAAATAAALEAIAGSAAAAPAAAAGKSGAGKSGAAKKVAGKKRLSEGGAASTKKKAKSS